LKLKTRINKNKSKIVNTELSTQMLRLLNGVKQTKVEISEDI